MATMISEHSFVLKIDDFYLGASLSTEKNTAHLRLLTTFFKESTAAESAAREYARTYSSNTKVVLFKEGLYKATNKIPAPLSLKLKLPTVIKIACITTVKVNNFFSAALIGKNKELRLLSYPIQERNIAQKCARLHAKETGLVYKEDAGHSITDSYKVIQVQKNPVPVISNSSFQNSSCILRILCDEYSLIDFGYHPEYVKAFDVAVSKAIKIGGTVLGF